MAWRQRSAKLRRKEGLLPGRRGYQPPRRCRWFMPTRNLASHKWRRLATHITLARCTVQMNLAKYQETNGWGWRSTSGGPRKAATQEKFIESCLIFPYYWQCEEATYLGKGWKKLRRWRAFSSPNFPLDLNPVQRLNYRKCQQIFWY